MAKKFQAQIDQLNGKMWWLDNVAAGRAGPGRQQEMEAHMCKPEIGQRGDRNRRFPEKPLISPAPFDGKSAWDDYRVQSEFIADLSGWDEATKAIYLTERLQGRRKGFSLIWTATRGGIIGRSRKPCQRNLAARDKLNFFVHS